jgi:hypothetical protein
LRLRRSGADRCLHGRRSSACTGAEPVPAPAKIGACTGAGPVPEPAKDRCLHRRRPVLPGGEAGHRESG